MTGFLPPFFLRPSSGHVVSAQTPAVTLYHQDNKTQPLSLIWQTLYKLELACFSSFDPLTTIP